MSEKDSGLRIHFVVSFPIWRPNFEGHAHWTADAVNYASAVRPSALKSLIMTNRADDNTGLDGDEDNLVEHTESEHSSANGSYVTKSGRKVKKSKRNKQPVAPDPAAAGPSNTSVIGPTDSLLTAAL